MNCYIERLKKAFKMNRTDNGSVLEKAKEQPTLDYSQWQRPTYSSTGKVKPIHHPNQHTGAPAKPIQIPKVEPKPPTEPPKPETVKLNSRPQATPEERINLWRALLKKSISKRS